MFHQDLTIESVIIKIFVAISWLRFGVFAFLILVLKRLSSKIRPGFLALTTHPNSQCYQVVRSIATEYSVLPLMPDREGARGYLLVPMGVCGYLRLCTHLQRFLIGVQVYNPLEMWVVEILSGYAQILPVTVPLALHRFFIVFPYFLTCMWKSDQ